MMKHHDPSSNHSPMRPPVRIEVSDFGPISKGSVVLRPLTVFVGPSNAGKTYLATLIYSLHRVLAGFRHPCGEDLWHDFYLKSNASRDSPRIDKTQLLKFIDHLSDKEGDLMWSNLPDTIAQLIIRSSESSNLGLCDELARCFDIGEVSQLIRRPSPSRSTCVSVYVGDDEVNNWTVSFDVSEKEATTGIKINDFILAPSGRFRRPYLSRRLLERNQSKQDFRMSRKQLSLVIEQLSFLMRSPFGPFKQNSIHYLPAARSGIMQSHRVIASSLVSRSTRAGVERFKEIPTFSGPLADFMERLLLYKERRETPDFLRRIAESLETETLSGRIIEKSTMPGVYPEFVYRPTETKQNIRLSRASSMVSELAPIVLFLRGVVHSNSTVIIEEPEAHLHPAAQTQLAVTLARMVRVGLRVVVTTHSDWLLQEIANLLREGLLHDQDNEGLSGSVLSKHLQQDEVGVWLFRSGNAGSTIEEIPFDTSEGVEPREYEDVAEELYNRSANLQNRIEEMRS